MIIKQLHNPNYKFIYLKNDKSPISGVGWKEEHSQITYDQYQQGNIGIITGFNNLRVIDIDIKRKLSNGSYEIVEEWVQEAEKFILKYVEQFGKTLIIRTPSEGYHIYLHSEYKSPDKAFFLFNKNLHGEFRSHDSYVATVPSVVNDKQYTIFYDNPIHNVNMNDLAVFLTHYADEDNIYGSRTDLSKSGNEMSLLCSLIKHRMSKDKILQVMSYMPKWSKSPEAYRTHTMKSALKFLNIKALPEDKEIQFESFNIQTMLENGIPIIEYAIDPFLLKNGITLFVAPPSSMKSFLAQQLAISCCAGIPFLEKFETKKQNVLYLDEENGIIGIANRIKYLLNGHRLTNEDLDNRLTCVSYQSMRFDDELKLDELRRIIKESRIDVVIVDSIVRFVDGDENKSSDIKFIFDRLKTLCNEFNLSILILHHTTKTNGRSPRGSGDFLAAPDNVFSIKKSNDVLIIQSEKERYKKNLDDGHVIKIISADNSVKLQYDKPFIEAKSKKDKCIIHVREFIKGHGVNTFKTSELKTYLEDFDIKLPTIYRTLKDLIELGEIECVSKGSKSMYKIIGDEK